MLTSILPMAQRYSNMNNSNIYLLFFIANYLRYVGKGSSFVAKKTLSSFKMYTFTTLILTKK
jgi:hypothetical protein